MGILQLDLLLILLTFQLGHDVREFFLSGCDVYIDKSLQGGLKAIEGCDYRVVSMVDKAQDNSKV